LLKNVKENLKYFSNIRLFETGRIFYENDGKYFEENKIAAIDCHKEAAKQTNIFFELKGAVEILFEKLVLPDVWFNDAISPPHQTSTVKNIPGGQHPIWCGGWLEFTHVGRRAEIKSGDTLVGWVAELKPEILDSLGIKERIAAFELDFNELIKLASEEREYVPPSKYPAIIRDLSVSVEQTTKIESVLNVIETAGGEFLQDTDLFDIYEGLAGNKKSLAFRLIYQSDDRNLTDEEVNKLQEKIIKAIEEEGWEVRK
jgi:phenylalanyl-tRNA synthetase beta chain